MGKPYLRDVSISDLIPYSSRLSLFEDGEGLCSWTATGSASAAVVKDGTKAYVGSNCIKASIAEGAPAPGNYFKAQRQFAIRHLGRVRFGMFFMLEDPDDKIRFKFTINLLSNGIMGGPSIQYDMEADAWTYLNSGSADIAIPGFSPTIIADNWHYIELSFNTLKNEYDEILLGSRKADLSGIAYPATALLNYESGSIHIFGYVGTTGTSNVLTYLDQLFLLYH